MEWEWDSIFALSINPCKSCTTKRSNHQPKLRRENIKSRQWEQTMQYKTFYLEGIGLHFEPGVTLAVGSAAVDQPSCSDLWSRRRTTQELAGSRVQHLEHCQADASRYLLVINSLLGTPVYTPLIFFTHKPSKCWICFLWKQKKVLRQDLEQMGRDQKVIGYSPISDFLPRLIFLKKSI